MDYSLLIPHPFERQILLISHPDGFRLPRLTVPTTWLGHPAHEHLLALLLNQKVHEHFGLVTVVLMITRLNVDRLVTFEVQHHSSLSPLIGNWVDAEKLASCTFAEPDQRLFQETWFSQEEEGVQSLHMPWQRCGWFAETTGWMAHQLDRQGLSLQAPVGQLYTKYGACMLRAETSGGSVYLKALPPSFGREPRLVAYLAQFFPHLLPHVLAIDEARNWLLMFQAPGTLLYDRADISAWERALCIFAQLQIACIHHNEKLLSIGCPDLRLPAISVQLEPMLNNDVALHVNQPGGLSAEQIVRLRTRVPELEISCQRLSNYGIPATLEHGDFNPMNILVQNEQITYLDWTDASLTHPFFSALRLLTYFIPTSLKERNPDLIKHLQIAYLEPWTIYEPMDCLLDALEDAKIPMLLHRALNYFLLDFTQHGISWERSTVVTRYLQAI